MINLNSRIFYRRTENDEKSAIWETCKIQDLHEGDIIKIQDGEIFLKQNNISMWKCNGTPIKNNKGLWEIQADPYIE